MPARVVSNTSPLQYLHALRLLHLLPDLYGEVLVPSAVVDELAAGVGLGLDLPAVAELPWAQVLQPSVLLPQMAHLGRGEAAAISLAAEFDSSLVLLDDRAARTAAEELGLTVTGTLGLLLAAKNGDLIEAVAPYLVKLRAAGFRISPHLEEQILRLAGEMLP